MERWIIDNDARSKTLEHYTMVNALKAIIENNNQDILDICTGYFSPKVWELLGKTFETLRRCRILIGKPYDSPGLTEAKIQARIQQELEEMPLNNEHKQYIKDLIKFIGLKDTGGKYINEVKLLSSPFLHAKLYLFPEFAIVGSSNFTFSGLTRNTELNLLTRVPEAINQLYQWFEFFFKKGTPYNKDLLEVLDCSKLGNHIYTPFEVFMKIAYEQHKGSIHKDSKNQIELAEFQQEGVNKAIQSVDEFGGVLVADAVGLGKSFIAMGILEKLFYDRRKDYRKGIVFCPAQLNETWNDYMDEYRFPCKVVSIQKLSLDIPKGEYDIIVIDESHNFRNPNSNRHRNILKMLQRGSENKKVILLTATPINTSMMDLYHQLRIITKGRNKTLQNLGIMDLKDFFKNIQNEDILLIKENLMVSRSRAEIKFRQKKLNQDLILPGGKSIQFPDRNLSTIQYNIIENSKEFYDRVFEMISELQFPMYNLEIYKLEEKKDESLSKKFQGIVAMLTIMFLKRLEASIHTFLNSINIQIKLCDAFMTGLNKGYQISTPLVRELYNMIEPDKIEDDRAPTHLIQELLEEDKLKGYMNEIDHKDFKHNFLDNIKEDLDKEKSKLAEIYNYVNDIFTKGDKKLETLKDILENKIRNEKAIIFSYYKDTADYVFEQLQNDDSWSKKMGDIKIEKITSDVSSQKKRKELIKRFAPVSNLAENEILKEEEDEIQIIVCTDVLSEGLNLQDAKHVINYDLHWNPVRMIQRAGRIDRIGSLHKEIIIHNFYPEEGLEDLLNLVERIKKRLKMIDSTVELDGVVISEEDIDQNTKDIIRIRDEDISLIDEYEAKLEFVGLDRSKKLLLEEIKNKGLEYFSRIPLGIHSGMVTLDHSGLIVVIRIKRWSSDRKYNPIMVWAYEPDFPEKYESVNKNGLIINKSLIENIMISSPNVPPAIVEEEDLLERVVKVIVSIKKTLKQQEIAQKMTEGSLEEGNKKYYDIINQCMSEGTIKEEEAERFLYYLKKYPFLRIKNDIQAVDELNDQLKSIETLTKNQDLSIEEFNMFKRRRGKAVKKFLESVYSYFDIKNIVKDQEKKGKREIQNTDIELVGFLRLFTKETYEKLKNQVKD